MKPLQPIARIAFVAAIIGPIQSVSGWLISGALWPGFDPIRQTISELASPESPVRYLQSGFFLLGGTLTLIAAIFARTFAMPGRIALFLTAICTYGLTLFPTPLIGSSPQHKFFAIGSFALSAGWLLFATRFRRDAPWVLRPTFTVGMTLAQTVLAVAFLMVWANPSSLDVGLWERVVATAQTLAISFVVLVCWRLQRIPRGALPSTT